MCGHSEGCIYKGKKLLYALMEYSFMGLKSKILLATKEISLFDTYFQYGLNDDNNLAVNYDEPDSQPYQIVYGSIMSNLPYKDKELVNLVYKMKGYPLLELIDENEVRVSVYDDILMLEHGKAEGNYPFVALMKTKDTFSMYYSNTMFPKQFPSVFESLVNRPYLLACRYAIRPKGLTKENWKSYITEETMKSINEIADLYTGDEKESRGDVVRWLISRIKNSILRRR